MGRNDNAIALWSKLVRPGQPLFQKELAEAHNSRAISLDARGRDAEALEAHQQALAIRDTLARLQPSDPDVQRDLGGTLNNIGVLLEKNGRGLEALAMYRRAAEHSEIAFARAPHIIRNGHFLMVQQNNIAYAERQLGNGELALAAYRRVVAVAQKLARDNPAVPALQSALLNAYRELANFQRVQNQTEDAGRTLRLAREVIERLPTESADDLFKVACVRAECAAFIGHGRTEPTTEQEVEQKREANLALEALRKSVALGFHDLGRLRHADELKILRGREAFKLIEADVATRVAAAPERLKAGKEALTLRRKLLSADPNNKRLQADIAASQHAIGELQLALGRPDEALKSFAQAWAARARLAGDEPANAAYGADLRATLLSMGDLHWRAGRLAEAAAWWGKFLDQADAALNREPHDAVLRSRLAHAETQIAEAYAGLGLWREAAALFSRSFRDGNSQADRSRPTASPLRP